MLGSCFGRKCLAEDRGGGGGDYIIEGSMNETGILVLLTAICPLKVWKKFVKNGRKIPKNFH